MRDIPELRREVDRIDDAIIALLNRRFGVTDEIHRRKAEKRSAGEECSALDPRREAEILARVAEETVPAHRDTACAVFERIFSGVRGEIETIARGVAVRDGKVLLCRAKGGSSTYLPGGHIDFGETGAEALRREVREELGVEATVGPLEGVVENSFLQHGRRHAEINLVYPMTLADAPDAPLSREDWIEFEWRPIADLDAANLLPSAMVEHVRKG